MASDDTLGEPAWPVSAGDSHPMSLGGVAP